MNGPEPFSAIDDQPPAMAAVRRFTVLTVNTHKGFTALNRRFILPELREAVRSVSADVVFLQEVHGTHEHHPRRYSNWPTMPQYEFLADTLWPQFAYGRNAVYPAGDHGNALLSKFQIIRHDNLGVSISGHENRGILHCVLRLPADGPEVHAICVHLGLRETHRNEQLKLLRTIRDTMRSTNDILGNVMNLQKENSELAKQVEIFNRERVKIVKQGLISAMLQENGVNILSGQVGMGNPNMIKDLAYQLKGEVENMFLVIGAVIDGKPLLTVMISENIVAEKGLDAGKIVREAGREIQGGGGGQPFYATAGGKNAAGLQAAIEKALSFLTN